MTSDQVNTLKIVFTCTIERSLEAGVDPRKIAIVIANLMEMVDPNSYEVTTRILISTLAEVTNRDAEEVWLEFVRRN